VVSDYFDWPLVRYYLGSGDLLFRVEPEPSGADPRYGRILMAVPAGFVAAFLVPRTLTMRAPADLLWVIRAAATLAPVLYEARWFL
jgi:hypothetical protein